MPWQAHIWIGVKIHDYVEARQALLALEKGPGVKLKHGPAGAGSTVAGTVDELLPDIAFLVPLVYKGKSVVAKATMEVDREHGVTFPVPNSRVYTAALVGIHLTSRYSPAILDEGHRNGRPEPFELDLDALQDLLAQVRGWWPEARVLMMDIWH